MISHGYLVKEQDDPIVDVVEAAVSGFSECLEPGAYLVDVIPLRKPHLLLRCIVGNANHSSSVRYVPDWFPGAGWKSKAKRFANLLEDMAEIPHQFTKDQVVSQWPHSAHTVGFS